MCFLFFFFNDTATTEIYTLSLHDALPIYGVGARAHHVLRKAGAGAVDLFAQRAAGDGEGVQVQQGLELAQQRSEEHTSELQSPCNLVCRLLLEKTKRFTLPGPPHLTRLGI